MSGSHRPKVLAIVLAVVYGLGFLFVGIAIFVPLVVMFTGLVSDTGIDPALHGLGRHLVRERQRPLDDLLHQAVGVRAGGVDPQEEGLQEGALAGGGLRQPAKEVGRGAQVGVRAGIGADQHQAADQLGMPQRQLLGDDAPPRLADDVGSRDPKRPQQPGGVIGGGGHRVAFVHPKATGGVLTELVQPAAGH